MNLYDYLARSMNPAEGRFTSIDPLAEKYYSISPYVYCADNLVMYIDLKGDSLTLTGNAQEVINAIYNGLEKDAHVTMKFGN